MFGPALLVNPVDQEGATSRELYLRQTTWYDFWTGEKLDAGKRMQADAPLNRIPKGRKVGSVSIAKGLTQGSTPESFSLAARQGQSFRFDFAAA